MNHNQAYDLPSPRTALFGAQRPSANPRLHTLAKPYARPASYNDAQAGPSSLGRIQNGNLSPPKSPTKQLPSTRSAIPKSFSSSNLGQMTRSGSESSLFSGIRSMLSRPLAWLATPSRSQQGGERAQGKKRDGAWDEEEPGTPTEDDRGQKRARRRSPTPPQLGEYAPEHRQVTGRAITATMLPPLPADISLRPKSKQSASAVPPNFSRPLKSSQSMPYLDPPSGMLSPVKKRNVLVRSRRVDLAAEEEEEGMGQEEQEKDKWSPWKDSHPGRTRASLTPARYTPMRNVDGRDSGFPSGSPFRVPQSPLAARQPAGMTRSATTSRLRRDSTAASDVSMGRESARGESAAMAMNGHRAEPMSPGGVQRGSSALNWYMKETRQGGDTPSARAASVRLGSVGPSSSMPSIRKGQFVWDSAKGFVRENDLKAEVPQHIHQNDAERILFALESMRKTPLADARSSSSSIPPNLVGSSSRSMRQAINVPLATAQAGDSARQKREKERLGDDYNVMISPYGRRKAVDRDQRDQRIERSRSEMDIEYRPSHSPSRSIGSHSEASSRGSTDMRSENSVTPSPAPTPRRSARNKKKDDTVDEPTPRVQKGRGKKAAPETNDAQTTTEAPKRRTRRGTADKGNSPPPAKNDAPPPPVPTITETAPSPKNSTAGSNYEIRDDSGPREKSSLRAKSDITKRTHVSAANSRAVSPSSGRYSAREEDLPPMEELETATIQLPSFSGINFAGFTPAAPATPSTPVQPSSPSNAQTPKTTLAVPTGRPGPLSRLNSSRPRASSPLASGSIVAQPESPPESGNVAPRPPLKPDPSGFFSLGKTPSSTPANPPPLFSSIGNDMRTEAPKKNGSLGIGKPSAPPVANGNGGGIPDFFRKKDTPAASFAPPPPSSGFSFNLPTPDTTAKDTPPAPSFSFLTKPVENGAAQGGSMFGASPAATPPAPSSFSFAQPAAKPAETAAPKPATFSFLPPAKPAEAPAAPAPAAKPNMFAAPQSDTPSLTSSSAGGFSFGLVPPKAPESAPAPAPASGSGFFGTAPAAPDAFKSPPLPSNPFGGSFGQPVESVSAPKATAAAAAPISNPFAFGSTQPAKPPIAFSFGGDTKSSGTGTGTPSTIGNFGKAPAASAAPAANPFSFGASASPAPASAPAPPVASTFNFGAPAATPAPQSNGFGTAAAPPPAPVSSGFGGGFGGGFGSAAAPPPATATPSTFNFGSTAPQSGFGSSAPANNGFGAPASAPAAPATPGGFGSSTTFNFGQASTTPAGTPTTFTFGAANPSAPPTPASAPTFGFGASAPPSAAPSPSFQFGAPSAGGFGGAAPPQFGAPSSGQPQQMPRFDSPQPGQQAGGQIPDAAGFSMGLAGDTGPPGSPGRRQIKPLRARSKR